MAKNPLLTASTTEEMLKILQQDHYTQAQALHQLGQSLDCKIAPRTGAHCYRIQYSLKKPGRTLFTLECNEKKWRVKANLYHISQYMDTAEGCSPSVKAHIIRTRTCTRCNPKCIGGSAFQMDKQGYFTCIGSGHYFENLTASQWEELIALLQREHQYLSCNR